MIDRMIQSLIAYALDKGLLHPDDEQVATNALLERLKLDGYTKTEEPLETDLVKILDAMTDYAVEAGLIEDDITLRDLFDTGLMGVVTPLPSVVRAKFRSLYQEDPKKATDYYYKLSGDTNYIRRDRIARNLVWKAETEYGELDITINLSKPEKATTSLAAMKAAPKTGYPLCLLCVENEGYAGRYNHPARQNHRILPIRLNNEPWYWQYSPYVYYNEHCICFDERHTPMRIDENTFRELLDFVTIYPHYFMGSNADLPIVGGSIFTHAHFQGGHYCFAMEKAPVETALHFQGFDEIEAGIVKWPMSVIRLRSADRERLTELASKILRSWRGYTDEKAFILAETDGIPHNTITPIARRRGQDYELDLVLRNNITTEECPLGVYHPHSELHHIKKENIGLIEVMGLAVLPPRLKPELHRVAELLVEGGDLYGDPLTEKHAPWAEELKQHYEFTADNVHEILRLEVGKVFSKVLEHAGVYARNAEGKEAFLRFVESVK